MVTFSRRCKRILAEFLTGPFKRPVPYVRGQKRRNIWSGRLPVAVEVLEQKTLLSGTGLPHPDDPVKQEEHLALFDLVLYAFMKDVLVCYRCGAQHRRFDPDDQHPRFDLEVAERYRQEAMRLEETGKKPL